MKKVGSMMYPKGRKNTTTECACTKCGKELTPAAAFYYVDSCNFAITNSAKPYCKECYIETYGRY